MKSIEHQFLDFCRSKPADEAFDLMDCQNCALAQFYHAHGYPISAALILSWRDHDGVDHDVPYAVASAVGLTRPHTFGAVADALEAKLLAKQPV